MITQEEKIKKAQQDYNKIMDKIVLFLDTATKEHKLKVINGVKN